MNLSSLLAVTAAVAAPLLAPPAQAAAKEAACPPPMVWNQELKYLDGYRVFTGPDGDSEVEPMRIDARQVPLLKTGHVLGMFDLPMAPKRGVQIVIGPPNLDLPLHAAPYKEMFIHISGVTHMKTKKFEGDLKPGMVVLFEDTDAKVGHGGRTGPCGYVALSIAP